MNQAAAVRAEERRASLRTPNITRRAAAILRILSLDPDLDRIATRTASIASALQQSHSSAIRKCAAVDSDTPRPPPTARYAAMHIGHFGTSASATLGSAHAAAPRARPLRRVSATGPPLAGPAASRLHAQTGRGGALLSGVFTRTPCDLRLLLLGIAFSSLSFVFPVS